MELDSSPRRVSSRAPIPMASAMVDASTQRLVQLLPLLCKQSKRGGQRLGMEKLTIEVLKDTLGAWTHGMCDQENTERRAIWSADSCLFASNIFSP